MSLSQYMQAVRAVPPSPARDAFVARVVAGTPRRPDWALLADTEFRYVDSDGAVRYGLGFTDRIECGVLERPICQLLAQQWCYEPAELSAAVWSCNSTEALIEFLETLGLVARFSPGLDGRLRAHLISAEYSARLIRYLESGRAVLDDGGRVLHALTNTLGIRRRVQQLVTGADPGEDLPTRLLRRSRRWLGLHLRGEERESDTVV